MLNTARCFKGAIVAPHHLASQAGLRVLQEGGNAVEAMLAAASTIAVTYPHMNGLGGDNFWLIHSPGKPVKAIDACGGAASLASIEHYNEQGHDAIPERGPMSALTVAGAISGWQNALAYSTDALKGTLPLARLMEDAIEHATVGVAATATLANNCAGKQDQLRNQPGFESTYFNNGQAIKEGDRLLQPNVAATIAHLVDHGLDDFYRGDLAKTIAKELENVGSPIRFDDLAAHKALDTTPLSTSVAGHTVYNMPPPTQGLASLLLLAVYEKLGMQQCNNTDYIHAIVEATKASFRIRDAHVSDPAYMKHEASDFLSTDAITKLVNQVDMQKAAPWPDAAASGDTVWLGAIDQYGNAVSFIQSVYWEFGSGVVLPQTGITWQNRGTSFSLDKQHHNYLHPGRRPFHTIQPALAQLSDGRVMPYGTMGGEGQPQTQAMIFSRHVMHGMPLQQTISAPRWLLGRTWGSDVTNLRMESRIPDSIVRELKQRGHDVEMVGEYEEIMGHAGALIRHPNGLVEAAADPRSDGCVAAH